MCNWSVNYIYMFWNDRILAGIDKKKWEKKEEEEEEEDEEEEKMKQEKNSMMIYIGVVPSDESDSENVFLNIKKKEEN